MLQIVDSTNFKHKLLSENNHSLSCVEGKIVLTNFDSDIVLNVEENSSMSILVLDDLNGHKLIINAKSNTRITCNFFAKNEGSDSDVEFNLLEGAELLVAYADFSSMKKRLNAKINLNERLARCVWHLASLAKEKDDKEMVVNFNHFARETYARMDNYGVTRDEAKLSFLGDAIIYQGAKKSITKQNAKIMLFDKKSRAKASPKLCIYENDVEASHGASEGQINQDHVFYLMTRGINEEDAKRLITLGYLYPIIEFFDDENIKKEIEDCIIKRV